MTIIDDALLSADNNIAALDAAKTSVSNELSAVGTHNDDLTAVGVSINDGIVGVDNRTDNQGNVIQFPEITNDLLKVVPENLLLDSGRFLELPHTHQLYSTFPIGDYDLIESFFDDPKVVMPPYASPELVAAIAALEVEWGTTLDDSPAITNVHTPQINIAGNGSAINLKPVNAGSGGGYVTYHMWLYTLPGGTVVPELETADNIGIYVGDSGLPATTNVALPEGVWTEVKIISDTGGIGIPSFTITGSNVVELPNILVAAPALFSGIVAGVSIKNFVFNPNTGDL